MNSIEGIKTRTTSASNLAELLAATPRLNTWEGVAGIYLDNWEVVAIMEGGEERPLLQSSESAGLAPTIGEQIAGLPVVALRLRLEQYNTGRGNEVCDVTEVVAVTSPDWGKVRRRVEDALRKTTDTAILYRMAVELGVKIY